MDIRIFLLIFVVICSSNLCNADIKELSKNVPNNGGYHYSRNNVIKGTSKPYKALQYKHSKPKAIDDPLPEKVNYILPVVVDFQNAQPQQKKPLFIPAFAPSHLIPHEELQTPVDKYRAKHITSTRKPQNTTKFTTKTPSLPKIKDVYKPEMLYPAHVSADGEIVLINHHHGEQTGFELFNVHDDMPLKSKAPDVIFKPGDDTSFADDLTVFDDYEHTFAPSTQNKDNAKKSNYTRAKSNKPSTTTTTKRPSYNSGKYFAGNHKSDVTANSFHGYVYEKPSILFET